MRRFAVLLTAFDTRPYVLQTGPGPRALSYPKVLTFMTITSFETLGLAQPLLAALVSEGYTIPTPIQVQAIPHVMAGHDLQGIAQTGTGKTAAFALPILHRLMAQNKGPAPRSCRVLVLAPTRELANQIADSFRTYGKNTKLRVTLMYGGVPKGRQARAIASGVDVLVATPGRLLDHLNDRAVRLDQTEILVLDEADHMLDLGFIVPIRKIAAMLPVKRQTLFFSATMPKEIGLLANQLLHNPVHVAVAPVATTVERVEQGVIFVDGAGKRNLLSDLLRNDRAKSGDMGRTLVFTRTKHGADKVVKHLEQVGVQADAIHGNKSQPQRERALAAFRSGQVKVLVATDIAARGIDVDGVTHVINFDLPNVPESYVHRIGRTARAGATGIAISFCDAQERAFLRDIEKLIRTRVPVMQAPARAA